MLSAAQLQRSVLVQGANNRFAHVWARLRAGRPQKIAVIGASVAMEGGCQREHQEHVRCSDYDGATRKARRAYRRPTQDAPGRGFALRALDLLNATAPNRGHRIYNAAADGWSTEAQEGCILSAVPVDTDLVIMDPASVYDLTWLGTGAAQERQLEATERVVRRLLSFPSAPAIILLLVSPWCRKVSRQDMQRTRADIEQWFREYPNWESPFESICRRYQVPCVSYRAAVSDELLADRPGFRLEDIAADCSHPADSRFGAQYLGDVLVSYLNGTLRRSVGAAAALAPETSELPTPVIGRNSAASDRAITRCYQTPYRPDRQVVGNVSVRCAFRKRRLLTRPPVQCGGRQPRTSASPNGELWPSGLPSTLGNRHRATLCGFGTTSQASTVAKSLISLLATSLPHSGSAARLRFRSATASSRNASERTARSTCCVGSRTRCPARPWRLQTPLPARSCASVRLRARCGSERASLGASTGSTARAVWRSRPCASRGWSPSSPAPRWRWSSTRPSPPRTAERW